MSTFSGTSHGLQWAAAGTPISGEVCSGDTYHAAPRGADSLLAVVDGLGHGPEAHYAASIATATLTAGGDGPLVALFERCHEALRRSRGVVMTAATIDNDGQLTWLAVGNVEGLVLRSAPGEGREGVVGRAGVVGSGQLPALRVSTLRLHPGDLLILATDGIKSEFAAGIDPTGTPLDIATRILAEHARGYDDALVLVVRYPQAD